MLALQDGVLTRTHGSNTMSESARSGLRAAKSKALPFHACWYLLALSSELGTREIRGVNFLGGRVVVYRTEQGEAQVRSAYCRHLGADLSVGKVVGETIQCPFHHWRYERSGRCVDIPGGDNLPTAARLFAFTGAESLVI